MCVADSVTVELFACWIIKKLLICTRSNIRSVYCLSAVIFPKSNPFRKSLRGTTRVSNSLDLDKDQPFVQNVFDVYYKSVKQFGSRSGRFFGKLDLGSNCYQQTTKFVTSEGVGVRYPVVTSRIIVKFNVDMRSNIDEHLLPTMRMQEACREQHQICMFLCHQVSVHKQSLPFNSM